MFNIALYLDKFKDIGRGEKLLREAVRSSIKEVLDLSLEGKDILIKNGEIIFRVSPAIKNSIFIKKQAILKKIKEQGVENINEVR